MTASMPCWPWPRRVAAYAYPEDAGRALGHAARYRAGRERQQGRIPELSGLRAADARKLLAGFLAGCPVGGWLPAAMAAELLSCYQVPLVVALRAGSEQEAARAPAQLGRRVVLKAEAGELVQPMPAGGVEVLIGVVQEPVFGPLVVVGLGGAATEVLGDHAARLPPLTDAGELAHAALAAPLLSGHEKRRR
jgi:acyl-CoA synthetase (NDP forming)